MKGTNNFEEQSVTERCDLQDHIVPYMLDERHVEDTLFIVVEEDFRFFNEEQGEPIAPQVGAESLAILSAVSFGARNVGQLPGGGRQAPHTPVTLADEGGCTRRPQKEYLLKQSGRTLLHNQSDQTN